MDRAGEVARWFGLGRECAAGAPGFTPEQPAEWLPGPGEVLLITGASGAGKSTLLRALWRAAPARKLDLSRLRLAPRPVVELFGRPLDQTLAALARAGLSEAHTYLKTPAQLSAGQQWRLRLALALARPAPLTLFADEFAALLDRVTAAVVARTLRRAVSSTPGLGAVVATSHDDLAGALAPDHQITCDFGQVTHDPRQP